MNSQWQPLLARWATFDLKEEELSVCSARRDKPSVSFVTRDRNKSRNLRIRTILEVRKRVGEDLPRLCKYQNHVEVRSVTTSNTKWAVDIHVTEAQSRIRNIDGCSARLWARGCKVRCGHLALETSDAVELVCMLCSNRQTGNNLVPRHALDETMGNVAETIVPNL